MTTSLDTPVTATPAPRAATADGPAPAAGPVSHRYIFTVHAVDVDALEVTSDTSASAVGFNLYFHTLARAQFTAEYARKES